MEKGKIFRKMLVVMGLLTMVAPLSLTVVACNDTQDEVKSEDVNALIVYLINNADYSKQVVRSSKVKHLEKIITANFIKNKLSKDVSMYFENDLFSFNKITINGQNLKDVDLEQPKILNAKINYDYGNFKNQSTNLIIDIQENRIPLNDVLKDFYFTDDKNVEGFLDANDLDLIAKQIRDYLGESLNLAGLLLKNQTINSVQLVADSDSENYIGQITLTWNLKLLEIWTSVTTEEVEDVFLKAGLLGYFYLERPTNLVKYINIYNLKSGKDRVINKYFDEYYSIRIIPHDSKSKNKVFGFQGNWWTNQIEEKFGTFPWNWNGMEFDAYGSETEKIKYFKDNGWNNLSRKSIVFDDLGRIFRVSD